MGILWPAQDWATIDGHFLLPGTGRLNETLKRNFWHFSEAPLLP
ncbi:MAG: hypothetical protein NZ602_15385 [Thermoguttaceae bacterium]|nr:hypothetical protein [Thermoguttaceae bacterium]